MTISSKSVMIPENADKVTEREARLAEQNRQLDELIAVLNEAKETIARQGAEITRLHNEALKNSAPFEEAKKKSAKADILFHHLCKMLDQHEADFSKIKRDPFGNMIIVDDFKSPLFASDYIEAAKATKELGRNYNSVDAAEAWLKEQPSTPKRDNLFDNFKGIFKAQ